MSKQVSLAGRARLGIPKLDTDGGRRPGSARNDSPWGRRTASVAPETESPCAAPRTRKKETRGHSCTSHTVVSPTLPLSHSPTLPLSHSPTLPLSHSPTLPLSHSPTLSHSLSLSPTLSSASHHAVRSTRRDTRVTTHVRAQDCSKTVVCAAAQRSFAPLVPRRSLPTLTELVTLRLAPRLQRLSFLWMFGTSSSVAAPPYGSFLLLSSLSFLLACARQSRATRTQCVRTPSRCLRFRSGLNECSLSSTHSGPHGKSELCVSRVD